MKYFVLIVSICVFNTAFSQKKKKIFLDINENKITAKEFYKAIDYSKNLELSFQTDSTQTMVLVPREVSGVLPKSVFNTLKSNLTEQVINNELIIIMYYPGKDRCNATKTESKWNAFDNDYPKKLNKITAYKQFWVYKSYDNLDYYHPETVKWQEDKDHYVEKLFFKYHYNCFSLAIVDKNGNFTCYFGEFGKQVILRISKEMMKQNKI